MNGKQGYRGLVRWRLLTPLVMVFALAMVLGLPGCSDQPLDVNTSQEEVSFFDLPFDPLEKKTDYIDQNVTFGTIEVEEGGVLVVPGGHATFSFEVEPYSFPADTVFSVGVYVVSEDGDAPTIIYEFEPDGLEFTVPATLVLDADYVAGLGANSVDFFYLNRNKWVFQGKYFADSKRQIRIPLEHFSRWGTGR